MHTRRFDLVSDKKKLGPTSMTVATRMTLPACLQEKIAPVLARPDLLITRNVEWANLAFGFEQVQVT